LHGVELSTVNFGEAELEASFKFYLPRPKKSGKITQPPDVDNLVKFVQDAFQNNAVQKNFYVNDSQFTKIAAEKNYAPANSAGYTILSIAKRVISVED
jgi:Holliday junction resolvase RusA-like endonuclease